MNKPSFLETFVLSAALVFIPLITRAALYENSKVIEGIVKAVSENTITLSAQSPDGGVTEDIAVSAGDDTKFEDVTLTNLKEGDQIRVQYHEDQDIKTAETVSKVQP